jgi:hypothetical protein
VLVLVVVVVVVVVGVGKEEGLLLVESSSGC